MAMEERLRNKILYKIMLYLIKVLPMIIAFGYTLNTALSYFDIDVPVLSSICGMSFLTLIFMYVVSYVFQFCLYHRLFLHYIALTDSINVYDFYIGIPISDMCIYIIHLNILIVFIFILLYLHIKHKI